MPTTLLARTPCLDGTDPEAKRAEILSYFLATFDRYESLFQLLAGDEAWTRKPISAAAPADFLFRPHRHLLHQQAAAGADWCRNGCIDPRLESMFAVGVDEMSWDDLNEAHYDWPSLVAEVLGLPPPGAGTGHQVIRLHPADLAHRLGTPWVVPLMGIEHERIHLETSSVLIRQHALSLCESRTRTGSPARAAAPRRPTRWCRHPRRPVRLGRELPTRSMAGTTNTAPTAPMSPPSEAARYLTSNGEFSPLSTPAAMPTRPLG
jgi:hypothetical protein